MWFLKCCLAALSLAVERCLPSFFFSRRTGRSPLWLVKSHRHALLVIDPVFVFLTEASMSLFEGSLPPNSLLKLFRAQSGLSIGLFVLIACERFSETNIVPSDKEFFFAVLTSLPLSFTLSPLSSASFLAPQSLLHDELCLAWSCFWLAHIRRLVSTSFCLFVTPPPR